ncbi:hypothetical protein [Streptomyces minutiscleroticus]|uniref:hypothetical protein n=1 Tax=Streptomyces minutiscleroticus TaxID=68238 RepID=UPI00331D645A
MGNHAVRMRFDQPNTMLVTSERITESDDLGVLSVQPGHGKRLEVGELGDLLLTQAFAQPVLWSLSRANSPARTVRSR